MDVFAIASENSINVLDDMKKNYCFVTDKANVYDRLTEAELHNLKDPAVASKIAKFSQFLVQVGDKYYDVDQNDSRPRQAATDGTLSRNLVFRPDMPRFRPLFS